MRPIFHLSFPVRDLQESVDFYVRQLGAQIGRRSESGADAFVFGAQVTLQNDPAGVIDPMPRTRHFGATLSWAEWESFVERLGDSALVVEPAALSYIGEPIEQGKMMIVDPSGNLIEIKAYRNPGAVLGPLAEQ
jgi:extradiol dioxygenase family protein